MSKLIIGLIAKFFFKYVLTAENIREWAQIGLEMLHNYILGTKSDIDDKLILPIVDAIKEAFDL